MKTKYLSALLGGLLVSGIALADVDGLTTSANLAGTYDFYDSGFYLGTWSNWIGQSNDQTQTVASVLGTHQDAAGQWYATTRFTETKSYDNSWNVFEGQQRYLYFQTTATTTSDQWVDFKVTNIAAMNYQVSAYGSYGSKQSLRGFTQTISPALGLVVDGTSFTADSYGFNGSSSWYQYASGTVSNSFEASVEATDGGAISQLYVNLVAADARLIGVETSTYVYSTSTWTQDVAISAPVPEPESYAMLLAGLGLMGAIARRRKSQQA